jgi:class 3 adenylate cyclase/tetratricopeptide (TPR) repeat protein
MRDQPHAPAPVTRRGREDAQTPSAQPDTNRLDGERRYATVMFADISGFTAISEKLDPEDVTAFINACFERLESIVFAHGGLIDEYLGDCIKAVFGFSPATGDPTVHAVRAALEIRDALVQFNRDHNPPSPLDVHIGLNSGSVIAVAMDAAGKHDFSVMGQAVRLAARLEDVSHKGQIYVGPETYAATKALFEYRALPPLPADRTGEPTAIFELLAPATQRQIKRQSERRLATVVFADVLGFEALSAHLDADHLADVMKDCFAVLGASVLDHNGVVDKYMGDGMLALFGVPNAIEDAPKQAVNAGIELRQRLARFVEDQRLPLPLAVHIGINTGLVIAGDIGGRVKRDFTVMGDTVNVAARLKEAAGEGAIYVGPKTKHDTRADFQYRPLEPLRLKGKAEPLPAYELLSVTAQHHRTAAVATDRMVFSEMVGRETELGTFHGAFKHLAAGEGGIVSLIGEAGLGKSRLLSEVLKIAREMRLPVFLGRSLSIGRGQSFHPFIDLLRHWAGITEDAGEEHSLALLDAAVRALLAEHADEVFPFITRLMGLHVGGAHAQRLEGIEGEALETLIMKSMRELLQAIARQQPTALVFEDLHWADTSSLNLLESLLGLSTEVPILFVQVFRPLFEETSDRILKICVERFAARHTEIRLEKLDDGQAARLIRNLLNIDDLPPHVRQLIASKSEGNPFYIEEVVRSLIDEDAVKYENGRFRVTEKINSVVIPGTIHDVIMARVDKLDESARQLLQTASVIGRHFYHRIIAHIIEYDRPVAPDLDTLKQKQLIQESTTRWEVAVGERTITEELEYIFKHALAQEAVYQSVLLKTRKELHGRVAAAIESLFGDRLPEFYATLAYHYTRAERLEPAEDYLCKAGEAAARSAASSEALQLFREAVAIYEKLHGAGNGDTIHRAFLEKNIGLALLNTGQHTESIAHFDRALNLLGEPVATNPIVQGLRWVVDMAAVLLRLYVYAGDRGEVPNLDHEREIFKLYFERGHAEVTSNPRRLFLETPRPLRRFNRVDPRLIEQGCGMYVSCAGIFAYSGLSFTVSKRMLKEAADLLRDQSVYEVFRYRAMRFTYHYLHGDWSDAPAIEDDFIEAALRHGMVWDVTMYIGIEGDWRFRRGDFAGGRRCLEKLAEIRDVYGYAYAGNNEEGERLLLRIEERKLEEAVPLAETHLAVSDEAGIQVMCLGEKAKAQILSGDRDGAAESLRRAAEITKREGIMPPWYVTSPQLAALLLEVTALEAPAAAGDHSGRQAVQRAGARSARRAIRTARKVAKGRVETYNLAARLWWVLGKHGRARKWWIQCIREGERMGARPELARAYMDVGLRIGNTELNGIRGPAYLESARQMFTAMGLQWDLQHLRALECADTEANIETQVA